MASLEGILASIPGYAGFIAKRQMNEQGDLQDLQRVAATEGLLANLAKRQQEQQARQRQAQFQALMASDPAKAREFAMQFATPKDILSMPQPRATSIGSGGAILPDGTRVAPMARPETPRPTPIGSGGLRLPDGTVVPPANVPRPQPKPASIQAYEFAKSQGYKGSFIDYQRQIAEAGRTQQNVYTGSLVPGVDAQGNPIFVQPSPRADTPPRVVPGVFPPEKAAVSKERREAREAEVTLDSVRERIARMQARIQKGGVTGAVVGPIGALNRVVETVSGALDPAIQTPALDQRNEERVLLSDVRELIEKDPNLTRDERQALYETIGSGNFQTGGSAIRTLNNILDKVENSAMTRGVTPRRRASDALPAGIPQGSTMIGNTPDGKPVYRAPNGKQYIP